MRKFLTERRASTASEYALLLAVFGSAVFLGAEALNALSRHSFVTVSHSMENADHASAGHSDRKVIHTANESGPLEVPDLQPDNFQLSRGRAWPLSVAVLMLAGGIALRFLLRRRRLHREASREAFAPAKLPAATRKQIFDKRQKILAILSNDRQALLDSRIKVRHLMSERLTTVPPNASLENIERLMKTNQIRHLLVCRNSRRLLGVISDRDLKANGEPTARDLMTTDVATVSDDAHIIPTITLMMERGISCLPVLRAGQLCGVLTSTDLMMALQCSLQILSKMAAETSQ